MNIDNTLSNPALPQIKQMAFVSKVLPVPINAKPVLQISSGS